MGAFRFRVQKRWRAAHRRAETRTSASTLFFADRSAIRSANVKNARTVKIVETGKQTCALREGQEMLAADICSWLRDKRPRRCG